MGASILTNGWSNNSSNSSKTHTGLLNFWSCCLKPNIFKSKQPSWVFCLRSREKKSGVIFFQHPKNLGFFPNTLPTKAACIKGFLMIFSYQLVLLLFLFNQYVWYDVVFCFSETQKKSTERNGQVGKILDHHLVWPGWARWPIPWTPRTSCPLTRPDRRRWSGSGPRSAILFCWWNKYRCKQIPKPKIYIYAYIHLWYFMYIYIYTCP